MDWSAALQQAIEAGRPVALVTVVEAPGQPGLVGRHLVTGLFSDLPDPDRFTEVAAQALESGRARTVTVNGLRVYIEPFLPPLRLVVVGAGHVAQPVAQLGKLLGFHVTVVDDRPEYASMSRFPSADLVLCDDFVRALEQISPGREHFLVLVTRGHRHDMDCLKALVERDVAYIGMIGSRVRVATVFRLLTDECGVDPAHFSNVYAPVGLDLGARSPAEIAVAVAAELLKVRYGGTGESLSRMGHGLIHGR